MSHGFTTGLSTGQRNSADSGRKVYKPLCLECLIRAKLVDAEMLLGTFKGEGRSFPVMIFRNPEAKPHCPATRCKMEHRNALP